MVKVTSRAWLVIQTVIPRRRPDPNRALVDGSLGDLAGVAIVVDDDDPEAIDCRTADEAVAFAERVTRERWTR